ncbi:MAG: glycosyltransferase family 9 protein [Trichodesmium sp. St16_bin4-tuft]|nr:glycosyltransferase family 9 protein [Trichodesmium sp. MAG_R01]MDE5067636.1 glycosyltransferase family 9 protein [Trichodesmium sp. St4_bin8_1]MDE5074508.1 glycosyltransferase family 9 protein [Trichodesmium sp. St5_bin8]MDE5077080.1 glycosyltransferase family 9 protein [Trichodesmium sp. St2_bin6]MDE5097574.1 glycosyltransferase family 9 protein [Trichodesmium sp. St16_bin4-tuft]
MRILALVPGGIGDQILFFPTLDDLKQSYRESQIDVIVEPRSKGAYQVCKSVRDVLTYDFKDANSLADWGNLLGIMRDREYEAVISLGQRWTVGLLLWLTGIPKRVGYAGNGGVFLSDPIPLKTEQYAAHMYHDLLQGMNINTTFKGISINVLKKDIAWAEAEQQRLGVAESGYILIHGGSSKLAQIKGIDKIYPTNYWLEIISQLQQKQPNLPVVLVKGPEDGAWSSEISQSSRDVKIVIPGDVGKLAAFIAAANLMLCTDSAPMHLAVAVGTYTIALFGPTDPKKLLPKSDRVIAVKSSTGKMADILPQQVLQKIWGTEG